MLKHFRKHSVAEAMQAELEEIERLRYKEDQRRDYHAAAVEGYDKRIAKLREMLAANGK